VPTASKKAKYWRKRANNFFWRQLLLKKPNLLNLVSKSQSGNPGPYFERFWHGRRSLVLLLASVARCLSHKTAKWCYKKLLDSAKNFVTNFPHKSAKSSEILPKSLLFMRWSKLTYKVTYQFFVFYLHYHRTRTENVRVGHQTFRPTLSFPSTLWATQLQLASFLYDSQFLTTSFKWSHEFIQ